MPFPFSHHVPLGQVTVSALTGCVRSILQNGHLVNRLLGGGGATGWMVGRKEGGTERKEREIRM